MWQQWEMVFDKSPFSDQQYITDLGWFRSQAPDYGGRYSFLVEVRSAKCGIMDSD